MKIRTLEEIFKANQKIFGEDYNKIREIILPEQIELELEDDEMPSVTYGQLKVIIHTCGKMRAFSIRNKTNPCPESIKKPEWHIGSQLIIAFDNEGK